MSIPDLSLADAMAMLDDYADGRASFASWAEVFEQIARIREGVRAGVDDLRKAGGVAGDVYVTTHDTFTCPAWTDQKPLAQREEKR